MKSEVGKIEINKLGKSPTFLNDLKTKIHDLDVGKLKTVPIDLNKLSNVVSKEVGKGTARGKLNIRVNNLENKIQDASTLIQKNQYNRFWDVENKIPEISGSADLNTKLAVVENKILDISGLATTAVLNRKIGKVESKIPSVKGFVNKAVNVSKIS